MNDLISLNNLGNERAHFCFVHGPDLIEPVIVAFLEMSELLLQLLELLSDAFVILSQLDVFLLVSSIFHFV